MNGNKENRGFYFSSNFKETVSNYYYVDKTLLIKDIIDGHPEVSLVTRPRRFGKSLNMDMLKTFFEKTEEDTSVYFKELKIWQCGDKYTSEQGKYPVIFFDFKEVIQDTYEGALEIIKDKLSVEFLRHRELEKSEFVDTRHDLKQYEKIVDMTATETEMTSSLQLLTRMLFDHYKIKPIILIDEYDVPIQTGHEKKYYPKIVGFIRALFSAALKGNSCLGFAVLTGVTRLSKESIFSGLNNIVVYSVLKDKYSNYYGFTKDEVGAILQDFSLEDKYDKVCSLYDGYVFGNTDIFNPWSVSSYIENNCEVSPYWANNSSNSIIVELLHIASITVKENLQKLMRWETISVDVFDEITYEDMHDENKVYSVMLAAGYLKRTVDENGISYLKIPNLEIYTVFIAEILDNLWINGASTGIEIRKALTNKDVSKFKELLTTFMKNSSSCYETSLEASYHNVMIGITAIMDDIYEVTSNISAGYGRCDVTLTPRNLKCGLPGVIFEFKKCDKVKELPAAAQKALQQIDEKEYDAPLKNKGITDISKYGIAFYTKNVVVAT